MSFKSSFGADHDATASQKKMKSWTTPAGLTVIIWHIPLNAESFSSLSLMLRNEVHLLGWNVQRHALLVSVRLGSCSNGRYFDQWGGVSRADRFSWLPDHASSLRCKDTRTVQFHNDRGIFLQRSRYRIHISRMYIYMYVHIHVCIHTHAHMYTDMYIQHGSSESRTISHLLSFPQVTHICSFLLFFLFFFFLFSLSNSVRREGKAIGSPRGRSLRRNNLTFFLSWL